MQKAGTSKNAHLKGRKRFVADLHDLEDECRDGFVSCRLRILSKSVSRSANGQH